MHQNKKKASPPKNWRGKGNVREADQARPVFNARMKAVGWGCLIAVAVGGILLCLLSILMAGGKVPIWAIKGIGLAVGCVMAAVAAFCCARFSRQDGFFLGLLCAAILYAVCLLCAVAIGERPDLWGLIKLLSMLLCGCIFGSVGVNVRRAR